MDRGFIADIIYGDEVTITDRSDVSIFRGFYTFEILLYTLLCGIYGDGATIML